MKTQNLYLIALTIILCCLCKASSKKHNDCMRQCGKTYIPYPFGFGTGTGRSYCYSDSYFEVVCKDSAPSSKTAYLKKLNLEIVDIYKYVEDGMSGSITVKIPSLLACSNTTINNNTRTKRRSIDLTASPFTASLDPYESAGNVFASVGCDGYASIYDKVDGFRGGCTSICSLNIPLAMVFNRSKCLGYYCCQAHSFDSSTELQQYSTILVSVNNTPGNCRSAFLISKTYLDKHGPPLVPGIYDLPVVLSWDFHSHRGDEFPKSLAILILLVVTIPLITCGGCLEWCQFITRRKRKEIRLRAKYFREKLDVQGPCNGDATDRIKLFTLSELKRYTDNFNKDRVLGQGGQGTVYKGMQKDGQVVAVKRSTLDKSQWNQFINEVVLLSQIKHRHVVKILGCCLEDDIPLVVYEFICNGTLSEQIENSTGEFIFTWEMRLRISYEVATAIDYLHSEFITPIYHRDIKSSNVLLDDKYKAKLSDFGISRTISMEQTHLTTCVQGTFGYMDPEYFYSGQYTDKSDVFSFGVILAELLTGQKPIRPLKIEEEIECEEENTSLVEYFVTSMNESTLFSIVDPINLEGARQEDIIAFANLAKQCLNPTRSERPTMKEVIMVLEGLSFQRSSVTSFVPNDHFNEWITTNSMITSSETGEASFRPVTYDHIERTNDSCSAEVEMRLLQTS